VNLGRELLARRHARSQEVVDKLIQLGNQRGNMMEQWEDRWEYLHLILEVYQFARDASVAEAWLVAHEPYVNSQDFGATLDAVEILMKKHEAFEKSAATQEERFAALERLTTLEMKDRQRRQQEQFKRDHPGSIVPQKQSYAEKYIAEFLPPPPEPEKPKPKPDDSQRASSGGEASAQQPGETKREAAQVEGQAKPSVSRSKSDVQGTGAKQEPGTSATLPPGGAEKQRDAPQRTASARSPRSPAGASPGGAAAAAPDSVIEGALNRKHEWESSVKKSSNRSWEKMYVVLNNRSLAFYKDQKHAKSEPTNYFHHEQPVDLDGATVAAATNYTKRPHV